MIERVFVTVKGIVQGVGFRPFVYKIALSNNLKGWVNNNSKGVYIDIEGHKKSIESFLSDLKQLAPPLSKIENIEIEQRNLVFYKSFIIKESERDNTNITLVSPDIALCDDCENDILTDSNRRYYYPFTNCTNCGPRYSIIKALPYDRDKTSMSKFKMCPQCEEEYKNPLNRRFHAQPNACKVCGPSITVTDNSGKVIFNKEAQCSSNKELIKFVQAKLKEGKIFAIKGLTGFHLVCDGENTEAIKNLRHRKNRPHKPFALMMKDIETIQKHCYVNIEESKLLKGTKKPIVLLNKKEDCILPSIIAPTQNTLGVMLPYTPLHKLLFEEDLEVLIMTSANISSLPLEYDNGSALARLKNLVDYFLFHDRDILNPLDDSVSRVILNKEYVIRRARGYVPEAINYDNILPILACGPNMKNTFSIGKQNFIFMSGYNGDLENLETLEHFNKNINVFKSIFDFDPKYIACDMHPSYNSTIYGNSLKLPTIPIQHHHAHIVSCMVENNIKDKVIGIALDGTGFGTDSKIWGGEFLLCDYKAFKRVAHLNYVKMSNNESFIKEPWKMAVSYICQAFNYSDDNTLNSLLTHHFGSKALLVKDILVKSINMIETSSMGRLFDAVASILGILTCISYEGQASIELENSIKNYEDHKVYSYDIFTEDTSFVINTSPIIMDILEDIKCNIPKELISYRFHKTIVDILREACILIRNSYGISKVALSGGVFQNKFLLTNSIRVLRDSGFDVYYHSKIPSNDGGVSLGQIVIANELLKML